MSTSSDLMIGDPFKDCVMIVTTATGAGKAGLAATCTVIDESGNRAVAAAATDDGNGWYHYDWNPDASGTWATEWDNTDPTTYTTFFGAKIFRVGQTAIHEVHADLVTVDDLVDDLETRLTAARAGYLDELAAANIPADLDVVKGDTPYIADAALPGAPTASSLAAQISNFLASGDGDFATGTKLPSNISLYDIIGGANGHSAFPAAAAPANGVNLMSVVHLIADRTEHHEITKTFFSGVQAEVIADTTHTDATLPSVTLPNITGTITRVYAGFKFRMLENTNAAGNKLSGAQYIQVRVDTPGAYANCITLADDTFGVAASTREGGDCIIGNTDMVGTVTAFNDTYEFMWDEPLTDQTALHFNDVQTFLIVSYY